jgi:hypothetical protein
MNVVLVSGTVTKLPLRNKSGAVLQNNSGSDIYLGGADVTADTAATGGYKLADGKELGIGGGDLLRETVLYALQSSGSNKNLTILEFD